MTTNNTVLTCMKCVQDTEHELVWTGRVLQSTRCTVCGHEVRHEQRDLMITYMHDLEHRIATKPLRMLHRAGQDPVAFIVGLPGAILRQPGKLLEEWCTLIRLRRP